MKRFWAVFMAVLIMAIVLSVPWANASPTVFFTAVNDQLLPLSSNTMSTVVNGAAYVPYTIFNPDVANTSLGVYFRRDQADNTLTLYGRQNILIFDLSEGNSRDLENTYSNGAISRNGMIYLPAYFVCRHFGLQYSYINTSVEPLIRIKSTDAVLNDTAFVNSAISRMQQYLKEYTDGVTPVTNTPTSTPVVTTPSAQQPTSNISRPPTTNNPVISDAIPASPSVSPSETGTTATIPVYLAFLCTEGGNTEAILDALDESGGWALFYIKPTELLACDDTIRRIVGSGYGLGLYLEETEATEATLEAGLDTLASIAYFSTRMVLAPNLNVDAKARLEQEGWLFWTPNVTSGSGGDSTASSYNRLTEAIENRSGTVRIFLEDTALNVQICQQILQFLQEEPYQLQKMTEINQ